MGIVEKIQNILKLSGVSDKEVQETFAVFNKVRPYIKSKRVFEIASGHGALGYIIAILMKEVKEVVEVDLIIPRAYHNMKDKFEKEFPFVKDKVVRLQQDFRTLPYEHHDVFYVGIHPCNQLCDMIIDRGIMENNGFAVVPCCDNGLLLKGKNLELLNFYSKTETQNLLRIMKIMNNPNFDLKLKKISEGITPKNKIIMALKREA